MRVSDVPRETAEIIRPKIASLIERGCKASLGAYSVESIFERIKNGTCFLLIAGSGKEVSAVATVSAQNFSGGLNAVLIEILEGQSEGQSALREHIDAAAQIIGANAVLYYAKSTQRRHMKGYRCTRYLMMKDLPRASASH